jgi:hypothetical protein
MKQCWENFWYEWHYPKHIIYGGDPQGHRVFRKQRLYNLIGVVMFIIIILYIYHGN